MKNPTLLLIDIQKGFNHPTHWGTRNNPSAEKNMSLALNTFRRLGLPVIHIQHVSTESTSPLRPGQEGVEFMDELKPHAHEKAFQKHVNSSFIGTGLETYLREQKVQNLVIAGLSTDHCVSTTTRMAGNLGFSVVLLKDATATFNRRLGTEEFDAETVHRVALASLDGEFATVVSTEELLKGLST